MSTLSNQKSVENRPLGRSATKPSGSAGSASAVMPDISYDVPAEIISPLNQVGMSDIEMPILIEDSTGKVLRQPARIEAFVSLDQPQAKGIHMSRLYLTLQQVISNETLSLPTVKKILEEFVVSQKGLSESSYLKVSFEWPAQRKALKSEELGWRLYPVVMEGRSVKGKIEFSISVQLTYSSTCPCSAALARQLIQEKFKSDFSDAQNVTVESVADWLSQESSIAATPHAQRSFADVKIKVAEASFAPKLEEIVDGVEGVLRTPVQSAVKRQDEQEFARLNAENLMFCEDAARRIKNWLDHESRVIDYSVGVEHVESLHPHSAVSRVVKGVEGGYTV